MERVCYSRFVLTRSSPWIPSTRFRFGPTAIARLGYWKPRVSPRNSEHGTLVREWEWRRTNHFNYDGTRVFKFLLLSMPQSERRQSQDLVVVVTLEARSRVARHCHSFESDSLVETEQTRRRTTQRWLLISVSVSRRASSCAFIAHVVQTDHRPQTDHVISH